MLTFGSPHRTFLGDRAFRSPPNPPSLSRLLRLPELPSRNDLRSEDFALAPIPLSSKAAVRRRAPARARRPPASIVSATQRGRHVRARLFAVNPSIKVGPISRTVEFRDPNPFREAITPQTQHHSLFALAIFVQLSSPFMNDAASRS